MRTLSVSLIFFSVWSAYVKTYLAYTQCKLHNFICSMRKWDLHRILFVVVMATISKRRRNEASILASFSISKRNEPANSRTCKDRSEANLLILHLRKIEAKQILFIPQIRKKRYVHVCINFKTLYLKKYASFLNEIFSETFCIHILLAQWIWAL